MRCAPVMIFGKATRASLCTADNVASGRRRAGSGMACAASVRCMGLSAVFVTIPPPSGLAHRANDGLPAGVDVHMLDGTLLVPFPAIALQCLTLGREGS